MPSHPLYIAAVRTGVLLVALLLSACASKTSVSSQWIERDKSSTPYNQVLIVGAAANRDRRVSFEKAVIEDLGNGDIQAWMSSALMQPDEEMSEDRLNQLAKERQAQAIIITRVKSIDVEPVEFGGRSRIIAEEQQMGQDYVFERQQGTLFRYNYDEEIEETYITTEYTTELETDVYDVSSGARVYTIVSRVSKQETIDDVIAVLSDEIAKRLRRDKVVR